MTCSLTNNTNSDITGHRRLYDKTQNNIDIIRLLAIHTPLHLQHGVETFKKKKHINFAMAIPTVLNQRI